MADSQKMDETDQNPPMTPEEHLSQLPILPPLYRQMRQIWEQTRHVPKSEKGALGLQLLRQILERRKEMILSRQDFLIYEAQVAQRQREFDAKLDGNDDDTIPVMPLDK